MPENPTTRPSFSHVRRWAIFIRVIVLVSAFLALVVMINYLSTGWFKRISVAADSRFDVSPQTVKVLESITNDITAEIFFDVHGEPELYDWVSGLLKEYRNINPRLRVKTTDYKRFPGDAAVTLAKYKLANLKDKDFVIFDNAGQTKTVYANQLSDYDINAVLSGETKEFRRSAFKGEMLFSSALFAITHPRPLKAYFLAGHGEPDPEKAGSDDGYGKFAALLKEENGVDWEKLTLRGTNEIPADCQLLIVAGPGKAQLTTAELQAISTYLDHGGRMFALLNNLVVGGLSGLEPLLEQWGVAVDPDRIFDPENVATANDLLTAQINPTHEVTKAMFANGLRVQLVVPRSVRKLPASARTADAPKVEILAATGTNAVAQVYTARGGATESRSITNVFPLVTAIERGGIKGVAADRGATRMVVVGDAMCLDNQLLDSAANHYFASFAVNWLVAQPSLLLEGLGSRPVKEYRVNMSASELRKAGFLFIAVFPGTVLLLGCAVWLRRRK